MKCNLVLFHREAQPMQYLQLDISKRSSVERNSSCILCLLTRKTALCRQSPTVALALCTVAVINWIDSATSWMLPWLDQPLLVVWGGPLPHQWCHEQPWLFFTVQCSIILSLRVSCLWTWTHGRTDNEPWHRICSHTRIQRFWFSSLLWKPF